MIKKITATTRKLETQKTQREKYQASLMMMMIVIRHQEEDQRKLLKEESLNVIDAIKPTLVTQHSTLITNWNILQEKNQTYQVKLEEEEADQERM